MPWVRLDDNYYDHKKTRRVLRTEPLAGYLHILAISYCSRHKTDGEIEGERVDEWLSLMPLKPAQKQKVFNALFELDLFEWKDAETLLVTGYLDWNLSRADRQRLAEQGRTGGNTRAANAKPPEPDPPSDGQANAKPTLGDGQAAVKPSMPFPSVPVHSEPGNVNSNAELRSAVIEVFAYWQQRTGHQQAQPSADRLSKIKARLVERRRFHGGDLGKAIGDCRQAVDGAAVGAFVDDSGKRHDGVELIFRNNAKLEDFMGRATRQPTGGQVVPMRRESASDLIRAMRGEAS